MELVKTAVDTQICLKSRYNQMLEKKSSDDEITRINDRILDIDLAIEALKSPVVICQDKFSYKFILITAIM